MTAAPPGPAPTGGPLLTDWTGWRHHPAPDARILSLVPSLTETLFTLGLAENLVGRTAFCVHPAARVRAIKSVGGTKQVNWRKVRAARPSHVVLNVDENPKELAEELEAQGIIPVVTHPLTPDDNGAVIRLLGGVFGRVDAAEALAQEFAEKHAALAARRPAQQTRVLYLIWKSPWMTVGRETYISRFLDLIGWRTWDAGSDARYPEVTMTDELLADVDLVLFSSEPFPFKDEHLAEFRDAFPRHEAKVRKIDGELVSWYGSRSLKGLAYLEELATVVDASRS